MNKITLIAGLILSGIIIYLSLRNNSLENQLQETEGYKSLYEASEKESKVWRGKDSLWRIEAKAADVLSGTLKDAAKANDPTATKILAEFSDIKKDFSNLLFYTEIQTQTISELKALVKDTVTMMVHQKDTTYREDKKINVGGAWEQYTITIPARGDTAIIKRTGKEEFDQVIYTERLTRKGKRTIWPFGKTSYTSEAISRNPDTRVVKVSSVVVKKKK